MDYRNFSALYTALCISEREVFSEEAKKAIELAKKRIRIMFDKLFPVTVGDVEKRQTFNSKIFFSIIVQFPEVLSGNEEKFLHFLAALAKSQKINPREEYEITPDVIKILNSKQIEDYVWQASNGRKEIVLAEAIEAIQPVVRVFCESEAVKKVQENVASWLVGYPRIGDYLSGFPSVGGEQWL